jgi:S1-C subfamily serine protease
LSFLRVAAGALLAPLGACAHAQGPGAPTALPAAAELQATPAPPPAACEALIEPGVLRRASLRRAVDAGLGRWLAGVDVVAERSGGRFQGWRILSLYPGDPCYRGLDLRAGDVVTRINGASLERPEQANAVFVATPDGRTLDIEYQREGEPRSLTLAIRGD